MSYDEHYEQVANATSRSRTFECEMRDDGACILCLADGVPVAIRERHYGWKALIAGWVVENRWACTPDGNLPFIFVHSPSGDIAEFPVDLECDCDPPCAPNLLRRAPGALN
jgi:hypothetical protein